MTSAPAIRFSRRADSIFTGATIQEARWFTGAQLSYAHHMLGPADDDAVAIIGASEDGCQDRWTRGELRAQTTAIARALTAAGVGKGDRVAAYMPNIPDTVAAFLACAAIGALWSSVAPEFGAEAVVDRLQQVKPKVLIACDGYRYGGKAFDCRAVVHEIAARLPSLKRVVTFGHLDRSRWQSGFVRAGPLAFIELPFDGPLWILFSSGTTGAPKPIVHGAGGILLEHAKTALYLDAPPDDRVLWVTTTGWMMWNLLIGVLLSKAAIVFFDGNPAFPNLALGHRRTDQRDARRHQRRISDELNEGRNPASSRPGSQRPTNDRIDRLAARS